MDADSGAVLHIIDSLAQGGAQSILKSYFESQRDGPARFLYVLRAVPGQLEISGLNVCAYPSSARYSIVPLIELRRMIVREDIGVLHCHLARSQAFGYLLKVLFFPRIALVFHEHGRVVGREGESALEALVFRIFLRLAWRRVNWFICISDYTRSRLLGVIPGSGSRISVVANPVPEYPCASRSQDRSECRRSFRVPDGAFVVGFASRLVERKGWRDFLDAAKVNCARIPLFFLMAGDGEDRGKVVEYIRHLGLEGRGRMLGHVEAMARFYGALDCFVMPSRWEPHGLAHLEAQSFGVPGSRPRGDRPRGVGCTALRSGQSSGDCGVRVQDRRRFGSAQPPGSARHGEFSALYHGQIHGESGRNPRCRSLRKSGR
jgi:L-malate glycosyltransferase